MSAHVTQTQCVKLWKSWSNIVVIDCKMIDIHKANNTRASLWSSQHPPGVRDSKAYFLLFSQLSTNPFYDRWESSAWLWDFLRHKKGSQAFEKNISQWESSSNVVIIKIIDTMQCKQQYPDSQHPDPDPVMPTSSFSTTVARQPCSCPADGWSYWLADHQPGHLDQKVSGRPWSSVPTHPQNSLVL